MFLLTAGLTGMATVSFTSLVSIAKWVLSNLVNRVLFCVFMIHIFLKNYRLFMGFQSYHPFSLNLD